MRDHTLGLAFTGFGVPLSVGGLVSAVRTHRRRSALVGVDATVVRAYRTSRYRGYTDGSFVEHPVHRVEAVWNHPADPARTPVRRLQVSSWRKHRPGSKVRLLVHPDDTSVPPVLHGLAGYRRPVRLSAVAVPATVAGLGLLLFS